MNIVNYFPTDLIYIMMNCTQLKYTPHTTDYNTQKAKYQWTPNNSTHDNMKHRSRGQESSVVVKL